MTQTKRAIIKVVAHSTNKKNEIDRKRRMYGILRRYTPEVFESTSNTCFAELTGLRTFFKMSYLEMIETITRDLENELEMKIIISLSNEKELENGKRSIKKMKSVSTYPEINTLFRGAHYLPKEKRTATARQKKIKLTIPFLGKIQ